MSNFDDAVTTLLLSAPFYGTLLMKMKHVPDTTIPSAYVNFTELRYNPDWFASLSLDECVFVLAHEVGHQALQHLPRLHHYIECGMGPDGKPLDFNTMQQALDYPLNAMLVESGIGKMPSVGLLDMRRFPSTMTPEEVYCLLRKNGGGGGGGGGKGDAEGKGFDDHGTEGHAEPSSITPADVLQAAETHKAVRGSYPAGMERLLGELKKPDHSPWRRLRQFVTTSLPGHDSTTWRRLQRRLIVRRIGVPGRVSHGAGRVGVVIDTSGSIGKEMLDLFFGHLSAIIADAMPEEVYVYWVDAKVQRVDVVKSASALRVLAGKGVPGGGGTDMRVGVRAAEGDKCDSIAVLTDGYSPFCDSSRPLMWAITTHSITASGNGKTIHI